MNFSTGQVNINLKAIKNNYLFLKKFCNPATVAATVKASSYGLGGENKIVETLINNNCKDFFVANIVEGLKIRKKFKNINLYVLNGLQKNEGITFFKNNLTPVLNTYAQFEIWTNIIKTKYNKQIIIHIDTGMNRLGFQSKDIEKLKKNKEKLYKYKNILFMSHLACADDKNNDYNIEQKNNFDKIKKEFPNCKYSLAASGGIFLGKKFHYDMVRPGISLYGGKRTFHKKIKHAVSLKAPIIQINNVPKGQSIGYSRTFFAKKNLTTATISVGYADGMNIRLSNKGYFHFKKKPISIIGRVSMDLIILDITKFKNKIKVGDYIDIYNKHYTIDDFAKQSGTIPYRIITCMSSRYDKKYIK
jgi:alanine racemase